MKLPKGWTQHPSVTTGGKAFFYRHRKKDITVVWDRFSEVWIIKQNDVAVHVNGFYHYKTAQAAMKAAEQLNSVTS